MDATPPTSIVAELWFTDGNVILLAGTSTFRVHRGILSHYSPVFRDLFTIPQAHASQEECPNIVLQDDPLHLRYMLTLIYDVTFLDRLKQSDEIVPVAIGIASLAHKYNTKSLFDKAVACLKEIYPSTLKQMLSMPHYLEDFTEGDSSHAHVMSLINLAHRIKPSPLDDLIPFAFYICAQLQSDLLIDGFLRPDGSRDRLLPQDLKRCYDGKASLLHDGYTIIFKHVLECSKEFDDCAENNSCRLIIRSLMFQHWDPSSHLFRSIQQLLDVVDDCLSCDSCENSIRFCLSSAQWKTWNALKSAFRL